MTVVVNDLSWTDQGAGLEGGIEEGQARTWAAVGTFGGPAASPFAEPSGNLHTREFRRTGMGYTLGVVESSHGTGWDPMLAANTYEVGIDAGLFSGTIDSMWAGVGFKTGQFGSIYIGNNDLPHGYWLHIGVPDEVWGLGPAYRDGTLKFTRKGSAQGAFVTVLIPGVAPSLLDVVRFKMKLEDVAGDDKITIYSYSGGAYVEETVIVIPAADTHYVAWGDGDGNTRTAAGTGSRTGASPTLNNFVIIDNILAEQI